MTDRKAHAEGKAAARLRAAGEREQTDSANVPLEARVSVLEHQIDADGDGVSVQLEDLNRRVAELEARVALFISTGALPDLQSIAPPDADDDGEKRKRAATKHK